MASAVAFNPRNVQRREKVHVILDTGSQRSYITERMRDRLALRPLGQQDISILAFGSREGQAQSCDLVKIGLETKSGPKLELKLLSVPHICEPLSSSAVHLEKYFALQDSDLADTLTYTGPIEPQILIGSDQYWNILTGEIVRSEKGPVAVHTRLGWVISGPVETDICDTKPTSLVTHILKVDLEPENKRLDNQLKRFWELEALGIADKEDFVHDQFKEIVAFKHGRYEVSLPWKNPYVTLPDNLELGMRRLKNLLKRLKQNPELLKAYDTVIRDQLDRGIVEVVENPLKANM
ncbi:PREDICTED: uncharacterized protein LOC109581974 [Amphimedon queenslandica]|uniref:DUF1758 domain-containing protein n=1 Tax=Amphimedon queenslandica TaxID=400682 RepID=A0AAN0J5S9_AMPQE|nr:PREDICTED: uncharacterized protein LOC109581974 [Amphimedon queenslandica]|eukprot:XP_019852066.1 PREDICTED: uncharacterized protein LOC109581974 [Amphimedon queenslandica]